MSGPKTAAQRPKTAKHLRVANQKHFADDPEAKKRYEDKIKRRAERKRAKR